MQFPSLNQICHLEGSINYTIVHLNNGHKKMFPYTLKKCEAFLSQIHGHSFIRIHKSYLVKKDSIKEIKTRPLNIVILNSGKELPLARRRKIK
ncbi:LytTr DNA-binding region [Emticicia oligotrophica DSM 17448]|uniref:LytTr DNA-binding region n=1 Tax=Emticicia oligotrophica (strain DSM 17448 / CIP 109782 / MTCC 6937 / GPTSA100-15) TaxID=929562 RepID=A0ABN4APW7_EMTOG|nr:LytTr DNA-binding region [Emticicia oligotrophica DSM 17448]